MGTKYWDTLSAQEQTWVKQASRVSAQAQKIFWRENVEKCMSTLKEAKVEIILPEKELFAEKTQAVLETFTEDPKMKIMVDKIQSR
jgi:TRAP-type C4-dicarboxylate transport system substrate-binding protein